MHPHTHTVNAQSGQQPNSAFIYVSGTAQTGKRFRYGCILFFHQTISLQCDERLDSSTHVTHGIAHHINNAQK